MKKFLIIGNMNAVVYKEIFPLFKENKIWLGINNRMDFIQYKNTMNSINSRWFTNLLHKNHNTPITLTNSYSAERYHKYDNYDAIEVSKTNDIPKDYEGVMGVPITFLDKYCPNQFEIIGSFNQFDKSDIDNGLICGTETECIDKNGIRRIWNGPTVNKNAKYKRILIKLKKDESNNIL